MAQKLEAEAFRHRLQSLAIELRFVAAPHSLVSLQSIARESQQLCRVAKI